MAAIRGSDTKPELIVRKALFSSGFRYRLHVQALPGKPDIVLKKYKTCIFVNGCFWHMHQNCPMFVLPKTRTDFWKAKLRQNAERDEINYDSLLDKGWKVIIVWECSVKGRDRLEVTALAERLSYLIIEHEQPSVPLHIR